MTWRIICADVLDGLRGLPDESVQMCATSPPYWGLRSYLPEGHPDKELELGAEKLHDCQGWATGQRCDACYICRMTAVFREVRRVLRADGTCWVNMGDGYASRPPGNTTKGVSAKSGLHGVNGLSEKYRDTLESGHATKRNTVVPGLKPKDLCGIPWRLAFSLQADGWYLRQDIIWAKPNPMPESVTDRCTKAHEYVFLLAKSARYYYDQEAVREPDSGQDHRRTVLEGQPSLIPPGQPPQTGIRTTEGRNGAGRNLRSVWTIATEAYPAAHFATFPTKLVLPCIKAGTSERGCCPACGAPWVQVVERTDEPDQKARGSRFDAGKTVFRDGGDRTQTGLRLLKATTGWRPSCICEVGAPVPGTVLDPFAGAGTTLLVADRLGRDAIGIELNPAYCEMARQRLADDAPLFSEEEPGAVEEDQAPQIPLDFPITHVNL